MILNIYKGVWWVRVGVLWGFCGGFEVKVSGIFPKLKIKVKFLKIVVVHFLD